MAGEARQPEPGRRTQGAAHDRFFSRPSGVDRDRLRATFEQVADLYDAARPRYPAALYDDLIALSAIKAGDCLLELGSATGIATRPLLQRGFEVVCVEPGARLAATARRNLGPLRAEIHVGDFETFTARPGSFALVFAATAWHWVDPAVRYRHAHELLVPAGHLAFWSASHAFPAGFDPFFTDVGRIYAEIGWNDGGSDWPPPAPDRIADDAGEIVASGLFDDVHVCRYVWEQRYTADTYLALLDTFSSHIAMPAAKREHLHRGIRQLIGARPGTRIRRHWYSILHVARAV
jgi:SAM-dependent methyltransferase